LWIHRRQGREKRDTLQQAVVVFAAGRAARNVVSWDLNFDVETIATFVHVCQNAVEV
jgi:hypothetical protein